MIKTIRDQPNCPLRISHYEEVKTYLTEMREPAISEQIVVNFSKMKHEWCTGLTIVEIQIKAKDFIEKATRAVPRYTQKNIKTFTTSSNTTSTTTTSNTTTNQSGRNSNGRNGNEKNSTENSDRDRKTGGFNFDELITKLEQANDKKAYLERCYNGNNNRFKTTEFKRACSKANCWEEWKQVADSHNVAYREGDSRARRVYNEQPPAAWLTSFENTFQNKLDGIVDRLNAASAAAQSTPIDAKKVRFEANLPKKSDDSTRADSNDNSNDSVTNYSQNLTPAIASELSPFSKISQKPTSIPRDCPKMPFENPPADFPTKNPTNDNPAIIHSSSFNEQSTTNDHDSAVKLSSQSQNNSTTCNTSNNRTIIISKCKYNRSSTQSNESYCRGQATHLKAIPDSGATDTMSGHAALFESITYFDKSSSAPQPTVTLGDDTTEHPILGYGWLSYNMQGKSIRQVGLYIPALGDITLISIRQHMRYRGCYFHAEDNTATLAYPSFTIQLNTEPEIEVNITPVSLPSSQPRDYDESTASICTTTTNKTTLRLMSTSISPFLDPSTSTIPSSFTKSVQIMKLTETATIPSRGTPGSIGYDVTAAHSTTIEPGQISTIGTGLSTAFNNDMYLRIAPRSSLALKHLTVEGGVVDSDYRGEIKVLLKNNSSTPFQIATGQKIAQFIFESANTPMIEVTTSLQSTLRGKDGFGSTDTKHHTPKLQHPISQTSTKARRSFLHDAFRINSNTVLLMNYSNPFRPIARRVKVPYHPSESLQIMNPVTGKVVQDQELISTDQEPLLPPTNLQSHILSDKAIKTPPILQMDVNPTITSSPSATSPPSLNNTTLQYADDSEENVDPTDFPRDSSEPSPEDMEEDAISIIGDDSHLNDLEDTNDTIQNDLNESSQHPDDEEETLEKEITSLEDAAKDLSSELSIPVTESSTSSTPRIRPIDKVNKSLPKILTMSQDALKQSIGFLNPAILQRNLNSLGTKSVRIQRLPQNPSIDPGEVASLSSSRRSNNIPTPSRHYGDIWHMDIGYGPCTSVGGMKYTLLLIDKFSRYKFVYGLTNLTTSLHSAMKQFLVDCGTTPSLIRTDFDNKFLGGTISELLQEKQISVEAAPPYRQHQNGMVERHWQTIVNMARNWLTSACLPSSYWYFAVKRACEVTNLLPVKKGKTYTTPFQLVYKQKADYRNLIPMFCLAYIKQPRMDGQAKNSWVSKTLKCILVGKCNQSDSLLFYHPPSKQLLSCADGYRLDTYSPSGPHFNQTYEGDFIFNLKSDLEQPIHHPPAHEENSSAWLKLPDFDHHQEVKILSIPIDDENDPYIVQHIESGDIHEVLPNELLDHNPDADPTTAINTNNVPFPHLPWIMHDAKATLYLPNIMPKPKRGFLQLDETNNEWSFIPGRTKKNEKINLPDFIAIVDSLINNKKLFKGWVTANKVYTARKVQTTSNVLARLISNRKVSAKNLHDLSTPTLLKHHKLHPEDRAIWDEAYREEYQGLMDIDTWEVISEEKYNNMKAILGNLLPTMAITTIKYDGKGNPDRAKYRIVALGNLDPHNWSKPDCFAPVLSQMELRFLTALAVRNRCIPKTGDVSQAFCQSYLPNDEHYVLRPPPGCPITPPNSYLKLKKTLYGLKRSPRHFYQLAVKHLKEIGLEQHPYSPCIFYGTLIEGEPPLYLGLYVDDFIYFSESQEVETHFEKSFKSKMPMTFNSEISYFLGINFTCKRHKDGHVSIMLDQESFVDTVVQDAGLSGDAITEPKTPYRSGLPIDSIPIEEYDNATQEKLTHILQKLVGNLNWLSISTRPDIAPATNMLAKYMAKASKGHIEQAKRVIKYLKGTKHKGILYTSKDRAKLTSFVKFPLNPSKITALCDANWGPQDQSKPNPDKPQELDLFKSRSMSGFLLWFGGPLHWISKRQSITARSSAEAEIYATDECTKQLIHLSYIIEGLNLIESIMKPPTTIYNDNNACVCWSKTTTTKGLRHIQMRENAIREAVANDFVSVQHIEGKINLSDMFTKEDKDTEHFIFLRDLVLSDSVDEYDTIEEQIQEAAKKDMIDNKESASETLTETKENNENEEQVSQNQSENTKENEISNITIDFKNTEDSGKLSTIESPQATQSS